jgi:PAT family beta-lactamase induction signal transducer AmpG
VLGTSAGLLSRLGLVMAPLLLAMYVRKWWPQADWLYYVVPVAGALLLLAQSRLSWQALRVPEPAYKG